MNFQRLYEEESLEKKIYDIACEGQDYIEAIRENNSYPYHYFLSPIRHNLFQWYPFKKEGSLLEIGAGYGKRTGSLLLRLWHGKDRSRRDRKTDRRGYRRDRACRTL